MTHHFSLGLFAAALLGLAALAVQWALTAFHLRRAQPAPPACPPISILKPLCGLDDDLERNLRSFLELDYPVYEIVLGVRDQHDAAFDLALALSRKHPGRVRLVLQRGAPGVNPKVNQLVTLERAARYDLLLVSDSNARVERSYLREIAALFADERVACVTHPIVGHGEETWGSLLDNLHMSSSIGPGMIGAKLFAGQDLVVGKSMALRRADLDRLGGFRSVASILAEDYILGRRVRFELGKRVAIARSAVRSVTCRRRLRDFWRRYARWSVIHRTALEPSTYFAQLLLFPIPLAAIATALAPSRSACIALACVIVLKTVLDLATAQAMGHHLHVRLAPAVPLKDALLFAAWVRGMFVRTVDWRGHLLRVEQGSRLVASPLEQPPHDLEHGDIGRWKLAVDQLRRGGPAKVGDVEGARIG